MMAIGPTGVGKSTLLNSLLCPAKYSNDYEDCYFKTDNSPRSVTKNITKIIGPWLGDTGSSVIPPVKVFDTQGLGDSDSSSDAATLEEVVEVINSEPIQAILLVFKAGMLLIIFISQKFCVVIPILPIKPVFNQ